MFLFRSAFWLGLALIVIQPQSWAFGDGADARASISQAGQQAVQGVKAINTTCKIIECSTDTALTIVSLIEINSSQASPMQDSLSLITAPAPRPRLNRAG